MRSTLNRLGLVGLIAFVAACSATNGSSFSDNTGGSTGHGGNTPTTSSGNIASSSSSGDDITVGVGVGGGSGSGTSCISGANEDKDKDGYTGVNGDCNDCNANVNPGALEVIAKAGSDGSIPKPVDEDCDGQIDNVPPPCDEGLTVADKDPMSGAKAIELCKVANDATDWGIISAKWVQADGSSPPSAYFNEFHLGHGMLSSFGSNVHVQAGQRMLALSSGTARRPSDPGYESVSGYIKGYTCNHPQGFPKESPACPNVKTGTPHDSAALELTLRAPTNAHGFSFDFNFFTYEWPKYVCSEFNDFFVALLSPIPGKQTDGNISFDSLGNPVSVNNAFVDVCSCFNGPPCFAGGKKFDCSLGKSGLIGTGFDVNYNSASTYWLATKAPVTPAQEITIRFAVYDSGDSDLDTTTLIDHWQWIAEAGTTVGTGQVPTPR
jgi:hypothetical protein